MNNAAFYLPEADLEGTVNELKSDIAQLFMNAEEKVLKQAMTQILGRDPVREDYIDFIAVHTIDNPNDYSLMHMGKLAGVIKRYFEGAKYRVDFIPA